MGGLTDGAGAIDQSRGSLTPRRNDRREEDSDQWRSRALSASVQSVTFLVSGYRLLDAAPGASGQSQILSYLSSLILLGSPDRVRAMKPLEFVGTSREDLRSFPAEARRAVGFELSFVQQGLMPTDWKPVKEVGPGAMEIRIHVLGEWRVIYVAKFGDAVYVLHAFQKKTQKTRQEDVELARNRYRQISGGRR